MISRTDHRADHRLLRKCRRSIICARRSPGKKTSQMICAHRSPFGKIFQMVCAHRSPWSATDRDVDPILLVRSVLHVRALHHHAHTRTQDRPRSHPLPCSLAVLYRFVLAQTITVSTVAPYHMLSSNRNFTLETTAGKRKRESVPGGCEKWSWRSVGGRGGERGGRSGVSAATGTGEMDRVLAGLCAWRARSLRWIGRCRKPSVGTPLSRHVHDFPPSTVCMCQVW